MGLLETLNKKEIYTVTYHIDKRPMSFDTKEEAVQFLLMLEEKGYYGELEVEIHERIRVRNWRNLKLNAKL